jgi:hypothetical protein
MISDKMNIAFPSVDFSSNLTESSRMFSDILPFGFATGNSDFDDFGNTDFDDFGAIKNPFAPPINNKRINSKNKRRQKKQKYRQD